MKFHARDFSLDDAPRLGRPVEVNSDQIETFIEQSTLYHLGNCQHTQNMQINEVTSENEKLVKVKTKVISFILLKKLNGLFVQPNIYSFEHMVCIFLANINFLKG